VSGTSNAGPPGAGNAGADPLRRPVEPVPHDPWEPPERSGLVRGVVLVVLAIVLGILLLPSATRAPLQVVASRSSTTVPTPSSATTHPSASSTTPTTTAPAASEIHVLVANATNVNGVAGAITSFLGGKGFQTLTAVNALTTLTAWQLYVTSAGSASDAAVVAKALGLSASTIQSASSAAPVSSTGAASVVVVAGQDLASRFAPSSSTTASS
jgi:hypothetical protein